MVRQIVTGLREAMGIHRVGISNSHSYINRNKHINILYNYMTV